MADEQQQDRTEQATPKRREDARKRGDVPRSRELTMTGVMLSGASALLLLAGPMASRIVTVLSAGAPVASTGHGASSAVKRMTPGAASTANSPLVASSLRVMSDARVG